MKSWQEYPVNAGVLQESTFFLLYINDLDHAVCNNVIYADVILVSTNTGQKQEVVVDFNTEKTQLVSFDRSNDTDAVDVKMDGSVLQEKSSFDRLF